MGDITSGLSALKRHRGRIPEWQRKHLPGKPGRRAITRGNAFLAPEKQQEAFTKQIEVLGVDSLLPDWKPGG